MNRFRIPAILALVLALIIYIGVIMGTYGMTVYEGSKLESYRVELRMKGVVSYLEELLYSMGDAPVSFLTAYGNVETDNKGYSRLILPEGFTKATTREDIEYGIMDFIKFDTFARSAFFYFEPGVYCDSVYQPYFFQGDAVASNVEDHIPFGSSALYSKVKQTKLVSWDVNEDFFVAEEPVLSFCFPIFKNDTTNFIGAFVMNLSLDSLNTRLRRQRLYEASEMFIFNSKDHIIAQTTEKDYFGCTIDDLPEFDLNNIGTSMVPFPRLPWSLLMYTPEAEVDQYLTSFLVNVEVIGLIGLLLLVPCIAYTMRKVLKANNTQKILSRELAMAGAIQRALLPSELPLSPGVDIKAFIRSAKEVAGDIYEVQHVGNSLFFMIGDVSGKGLHSSLLMTMTSGILRRKMREISSPAAIVSALNHDFSERNPEMFFCTMIVGRLELSTGELILCNAGHNPPILGGHILPLIPQKPIGVLQDYSYQEQTFTMKAGETLLFYTDGVTEANDLNDNLFGIDRLLACEPTIDSIIRSVDQFVSGAVQSDDITMLSIRFDRLTIRQVDDIDLLHPFMQTFAPLPSMTELAVEEVMVNALTHGKADWSTVYRCPDSQDKIVFVVEDNGDEFDTTKYDAEAVLSDQGGQGISLIRQIASRLSYIRTDTGLNRLELEVQGSMSPNGSPKSLGPK